MVELMAAVVMPELGGYVVAVNDCVLRSSQSRVSHHSSVVSCTGPLAQKTSAYVAWVVSSVFIKTTQTALQSQISRRHNRICRVVVPAVAGSNPVAQLCSLGLTLDPELDPVGIQARYSCR